MRYAETEVAGAFVVALEPRGDERGFFARMFCAEEFAAHRLQPVVAQINTSLSARAGTLRGLHYQVAPAAETKLVRCLKGAAYDVVVDLREGSPSFGRWAAATLTAENRLMMYVPTGCAHGFMTLEDGTEMLYPASAPYHGPSERVLRWNDTRFGVTWPMEPVVLSEKDAGAPDYNPAWHDPGGRLWSGTGGAA